MLAQPDYTPKDHPQPTHLYLHQQRTVEVIQLIEVPPPPPRSHPYTSTLDSDSFASSSCESSDDDSEEDESVCSSYCSSEENLVVDQPPTYDDTYKTRLNRVLAWRDGFAKATAQFLADDDAALPAPPSSPVSSSPAPSLKRKADDDADLSSDDDMSSQSSKRSRSLPPHERTFSFQTRRLSAHSCSACDACFNTLQSLRQHGKEGPNDACREAVEYGFES
ncbi:hypothetical protein L227DRAFT_608132 [Lentinus tigrinus ALCF2SS1-6]|uniref:Uncharacterized protein n=1 Tax=Lentinus tigrinus ALCF2SS1-6 TaxID=1328759 RepID=A0A5C2SKU4_9APHY|nr:hypothetical protein L227DRAFT_608132 [Lentinus tigrinus ALCF2SS1-6]